MSDVEFMKAHDAGCELMGRGTGVPDSLVTLADHLESGLNGDAPTDALLASLGRVLIRHRETANVAAQPSMFVEVSAVRFTGGDAETVNADPATAQGFAIYICNPLALHIQDVTPEGWNSDERITMREAHGAAFRYGGALAAHLGCEVETRLEVAADFWPSRFAVEPQRDWNLDDFAGNGDGNEGTRFEACEEARATQWAVWDYKADADGKPFTLDPTLVEDYPTRAAAEAAVQALERGEPLPAPEWPAAAPDDFAEGQETPIDIATDLAEIVEALLIADARTDAPAHAKALEDGAKLLARIGITVPSADDDDENPPAAVIADALEMLDCVTFTDREGDNAGRFTVTNDAGETQRYRFTVLPD